MRNYANTQVRKSMHKYASAQVLAQERYCEMWNWANTRSSAQVCKSAQVRKYFRKCVSTQVRKYASAQIAHLHK